MQRKVCPGVTIVLFCSCVLCASAMAPTCGSGQDLVEYPIVLEATYGARVATTFAPSDLLNVGEFVGIRAEWLEGFISCSGAHTGTTWAWQACWESQRFSPSLANVGKGFEMLVDSTYVFSQERWGTITHAGTYPEGCNRIDTVPDANEDLLCSRAFTIPEGSSITLGWYESTRGVSISDNVGEITINLFGYRCEDPPADPPSLGNCSDGILNQGEVDTDCGGPCAACPCAQDESNICHVDGTCSGTAASIAVPTAADLTSAGGVEIPAGSDGQFQCGCYPEQLGHGYGPNGCSSNGWSVRVVYNNHVAPLSAEAEAQLLSLMQVNCTRGSAIGCDHVFYTIHKDYAPTHVGANILFPNTAAGKAAADAAAQNFNDAAPGAARRSGYPEDVTASVGARVYSWTAGTTNDPIKVLPAGMEVTSVHFDAQCSGSTSGCWVIGFDYTVGHSDATIAGMVKGFNTFFLPYAVGDDALSYDYAYTDSINDSFEPRNFPCRTLDYTGGDVGVAQTLCCFGSAFDASVLDLGGAPGTGFLGNYRPSVGFASYAVAYGDSNAACSTTLPETVEPNYATSMAFHDGGQKFEGMPVSPGILSRSVVDAFVGMYSGVIALDEVELRKRAGLLTGTVGVEHTIDTFLGYANFKPATGTVVLDSMATQTNIHLEKTSFFSVSTHGVNDYTFLEYVNLRLVAVYQQDADFSGADESGERTVRTASSNQANYVQVTFTLGAQYAVDPAGTPLIPSTSVRAGHGTFFSPASPDMLHMCTLWGAAGDDSRFAATTAGGKSFNELLTTQDCSPAAAMCASPSSIDDHFVAYNIPLGMDFLMGTAGGPSETLANNVFVEMVISATEPGATRDNDDDPNSGGDPTQMKTTLTASIPIVEGGVNIFCDGFTAKTDLEDVADADIVVGSASDASELSRLRILTDIASTQLNPNEITQIDSDSIEAGLMTLVLKGNSSYFGLGGRSAVSIELEDVMTIHIMEDSGSGVGTSKDSFVLDKLDDPPEDNLDSSGLQVDGYCLNGAFCFEIDRASQRAHLEPTPALLAECPFNPPRPADGAVPLETCVTRRDVRFREFPARTGAFSTAMEICSGGEGSCGAMAEEQRFMTSILGSSDYARTLATSYANVIADKYKLNGVYRRAYWINPGYEWTPVQTGGTPIFSVSQKLYLFALITLDEGLTDPGNTGSSLPYASPVLPSARRRVLLQSAPSTADEALQDGQSEAGGGVFEFRTSPSQLMAKTFGVPEDLVATFRVTLQLTTAEACLESAELQAAVRHTLSDYLSGAASPVHTVQVVSMSVDRTGVQCGRRSVRGLLSRFPATAELTMLLVFEEGRDASISLEKLRGLVGVDDVEPISVSPMVNTAPPAGITYTPSDGPEDGGGSSNTVLIAGAVGGGVAAVLLVGGAVWFMRSRGARHETAVETVQTVNVDDLKSQLASEL